MTAAGGGASDRPDLDALRRRLYSTEATDDDRARYAAALESVPADEPDPRSAVPRADATGSTTRADSAATAARLRRRAVIVVAAVAVVLLGVGATLALALARPPSAGTADGADTAVALRIPAAVRNDLATSLDEGDGVNLAGYIEDHPEVRPPQLTTLTRAATEEHVAIGGATVLLGPSSEPDAGGHLTVILTLGTRTTATWRAARVAGDGVQRVAEHTGAQPAGQPVAVTVPYAGAAPTLLSVSVPRGTHWDAVAVFSN